MSKHGVEPENRSDAKLVLVARFEGLTEMKIQVVFFWV